MPGDHARLSPSASSKWIYCTKAPEMEIGFENKTSPFAIRGTAMHSLAEWCLKRDEDVSEHAVAAVAKEDPAVLDLVAEDHEQVQTYIDYVRSQPGDKHIEVRLKFNDDLWGTADCVSVDGNILRVIDLKGGSGVKVFANGGSQLRVYALMAEMTFGLSDGPFDIIEMHIFQPGLDHIDVEVLSVEELYRWRDEVLLPAVDKIINGTGEFAPGEKTCRWCLAKQVCKARAEYNLETARTDFDNAVLGESSPYKMTDDELAELLPRLDELAAWVTDVKAYAFAQALSGHRIPGHKLVAGRSVRKWRDEAEVIEAMRSEGLGDDEMFTRKLIGITAAEKVLGKNSPVMELTVKTDPAPTLVLETDKREEWTGQATAEQFDI